MEQDLENDIAPILVAKIDGRAGDWPSESCIELFRIARECLNSKMNARPEITEVTVKHKISSNDLPPHTLPLMTSLLSHSL